jgi:hypothetical protein
MNMEKISGYTPGPWYINNCDGTHYAVIGPDNTHAGVGEYIANLVGTADTEANARLIAAAPELYADNERLRADNEELRTVLANVIERGDKLSDWMREFTGPADGTLYTLTDWHECTQALRAALAQARKS